MCRFWVSAHLRSLAAFSELNATAELLYDVCSVLSVKPCRRSFHKHQPPLSPLKRPMPFPIKRPVVGASAGCWGFVPSVCLRLLLRLSPAVSSERWFRTDRKIPSIAQFWGIGRKQKVRAPRHYGGKPRYLTNPMIPIHNIPRMMELICSHLIRRAPPCGVSGRSTAVAPARPAPAGYLINHHDNPL